MGARSSLNTSTGYAKGFPSADTRMPRTEPPLASSLTTQTDLKMRERRIRETLGQARANAATSVALRENPRIAESNIGIAATHMKMHNLKILCMMTTLGLPCWTCRRLIRVRRRLRRTVAC